MKHLMLVFVIMAAFCRGVYAQEPPPETLIHDASLQAAGDGFCAAGLNGDVKAIFDFMFHPAMRQQIAEASGFESQQEFW